MALMTPKAKKILSKLFLTVVTWAMKKDQPASVGKAA